AFAPVWLSPSLTCFPRAIASPGGFATAAGEGTVGFGKLIRNRKVLGLFLIRVFSGPITTFYWAWLPLYLRTAREMSFAMIGVLGWLPNLFGMSGNVLGGLLPAPLVRRTGATD